MTISSYAFATRPAGGERAVRRVRARLSPARSLVAGFTILTLVGTLLLMLPAAAEAGTWQSPIDALFMATSAITTTGLIVVDTGSYYSLFGEIVVLVLFQIGGLGYMAFIGFLMLLVRRRLSLRTGATLAHSIAGLTEHEIRDFLARVFLYTLLFEAAGTLSLGLYWMGRMAPGRAFYLGLFHSVSAFCTAGFSLFADSFVAYADSSIVNSTIALVTLAGATGFFALHDLFRFTGRVLRGERPRGLSLHTKLMLALAIPLMLGGTLLLLLTEPASGFGWGHRLEVASFQALSASTTTGFNSVDIGSMNATGLFAIIVLMFVGASPGGTGGGIKTTTLGTVVLTVTGLLRGRRDTVVFWRRIPEDTVRRALTIGFLATCVVVLDTLLLTATESGSLLEILFEVVSALGTVGLSMGITAGLGTLGKIVLSVTMLIGRLGPLAIGFALLAQPAPLQLRHAEESVFIG